MITLAYILKDEEYYIERSMRSAMDIADEIVVLDTGSKDSTVDICRSLGAKIFHFEWNDDFSEARNILKSYCQEEWILMLDADEHLEGESIGLIREAVEMASVEGIVAYQMPRKNHFPDHDSNSPYMKEPFYPDFQTRLFANIDEIFFSGRVHEGVVQSIETSDIGGIGRISPVIHHHMFRGDMEANQNKKEEYYKMLSEMDGRHEDTEVD
jgi:glycosyltransferase involved in cell wall biosynthesis